VPHAPQLVLLTLVQAPLQHSCPDPQARLHEPQWLGSVWRFVHTFAPQYVSPDVGQPHAPLVQLSTGAHALPHVPQFFVPCVVHVPAQQSWPLEHALPDEPQWFGSVCRLAQTSLPQYVSPAVWHTQVPALHVSTDAHELPQPPQFARSVFSLTHVVPQALGVAEFAQTQAVVPWLLVTHARGATQGIPQAPQFAGSVFTFVHLPLQRLGELVGHAHAGLQTALAIGHAVPHVFPQLFWGPLGSQVPPQQIPVPPPVAVQGRASATAHVASDVAES
jgi:hypothetical protein